MVCRDSAAMIGVTRTVCAITMACGVNSRPHSPSGPERDSNRKIASPTTTGGRPISALRKTMTASRPGKRDQRDEGADRHADQRGKQHGAQADDQRQLHDGEQHRVAGEHHVKRRNVAVAGHSWISRPVRAAGESAEKTVSFSIFMF